MSMFTAHPRTLTDAVLHRRSSWLIDATLIVLFSGFVALTAQIEIPMWPVPITGQTLGVLLTGALLGSRRGALAVLLYLAEGAMGLPVFSGGAAGIARFLGPTGGYLIGFVSAAAVVGWLAERGWDRSIVWAALAMVIGNLVIYLFGVTWLAIFLGNLQQAIVGGLLPFIAGDLIKVALAAIALPGGWMLVRRGR